MASARCGKHSLSMLDCPSNSAATPDDFDFGHVLEQISAVDADCDWESTAGFVYAANKCLRLEREIRVSADSGHLRRVATGLTRDLGSPTDAQGSPMVYEVSLLTANRSINKKMRATR